MIKIKLTDVTMSAPANVHSTNTPKQKADESISASILTPSDWRMPSPEEKTEGMD